MGGAFRRWADKGGCVGLCRENPFTALLSEAIFAVTDDILNLFPTQAGWASVGKSRARAASLLNIMALWDGLQL